MSKCVSIVSEFRKTKLKVENRFTQTLSVIYVLESTTSPDHCFSITIYGPYGKLKNKLYGRNISSSAVIILPLCSLCSEDDTDIFPSFFIFFVCTFLLFLTMTLARLYDIHQLIWPPFWYDLCG